MLARDHDRRKTKVEPEDKAPNKSENHPTKRNDRRSAPQAPRFGRGGKKGDPKGGGLNWRRVPRTAGIWIFIILIAVVISQNLPWGGSSDSKRVTYTEYVRLLESGRIKKATIIDTNLHGELDAPIVDERTGRRSTSVLVNLGIVDSGMIALWQKHNLDFSFEDKSTGWVGYFLQSLPWLFFLGIWLFLLRQMQGGPKGVFSFGKSRARLLTEDKPKVNFKDVAGAEEAKQELQEIIEFLKDPKKFQRLGGRIPKGVLLVGPPGTGKTYMAKAVAGEAGVPFFSMSGSDFVEMFVGVGASRVRDLFEQGKNSAPCIIFIDELDAVGRHRGAGIGGGHDEREQTLNQLLVEMDGFESNEGVIMIAATNRPDVLDPALLRPGRFDRMVVVDRPDVKGREGILNVHIRLKNIPIGREVDLGVLARGTPGLSGADIENLINEAALLASRYNRKFVAMEDFENAKDKVMMGTERRSLVISDQEKKLIAYHEIGHSLVAKLTPGSDPVHKVTIIPRGRALGLTHLLPIDERRIYPKSYLVGMLSCILGGRCAEKLVFNEVANGAADDLERATALARNMVCEWGMSERLGALTYGKKEEEIFLGREISQHRDYSERTAEMIDQEVKSLVETAEKRSEQILRDNIDKLHALAGALLEMEVLDGAQIDQVLAGEKVIKGFSAVMPGGDQRGKPVRLDGGRPVAKRPRRRRRPAVPAHQRREGDQVPPATEQVSAGTDGDGEIAIAVTPPDGTVVPAEVKTVVSEPRAQERKAPEETTA